nr:immunoglobulin light chain junction region [Macaca mulatta]MPN65428.1 immunoglobulin light chain junction region [Macaca mulatta]MPN65477.1 immunoglobulin light chain junction region [Macaca mulatta]MPN65628.1 immunoglobulin light chain junction region [Macaca mulatta]MPN65816.1 immunoglobulin light chain junction region [Macaca mulatta]
CEAWGNSLSGRVF